MRSLSARSRSEKSEKSAKAKDEHQKKVFVDIEVIKEETEEDLRRKKGKRKYSFEEKIHPREEF